MVCTFIVPGLQEVELLRLKGSQTSSGMHQPLLKLLVNFMVATGMLQPVRHIFWQKKIQLGIRIYLLHNSSDF